MTIIISAEGIFDPDIDAKVGRWCAAPEIPDRCDNCWDRQTLAHFPAENYREEEYGGTIWRIGTCHRCNKKG